MSNFIETAKRVLSIESDAIGSISNSLDQQFSIIINNILKTKGRVILCGMGKSGLIGRKISSTLASTGTPSFFLHPAEAFHGDLGMITPSDVFIAISYSGETSEIIQLLPFIKDNGNYIVGISGNSQSTLALNSHNFLSVYVEKEACPLQLAPTSSTTATLALGDALAVTLMEARDFKPENFAKFHPGGSLGRRLLRNVRDEMHSENIPIVDEEDSFFVLLKEVSNGKLGLALVKKSDNDFGLITDGDLRRAVEKYEKDVFSKKAKDLMTVAPTFVSADTKVTDALKLMEKMSLSSLVVGGSNSIFGIFKK